MATDKKAGNTAVNKNQMNKEKTKQKQKTNKEQ